MTDECTDEFAGSSVQLENPPNHSNLCCRDIRGKIVHEVAWKGVLQDNAGAFNVGITTFIYKQNKTDSGLLINPLV